MTDRSINKPQFYLGVDVARKHDLCVLDVSSDGLVLRELAPNVTKEEVQAQTEPTLRIAPDLKTMDVT